MTGVYSDGVPSIETRRALSPAYSDRDARHEFQHLADIALRSGAELVRRDDVLDVRCEPLLVERDRCPFHLAARIHDKTRELDHAIVFMDRLGLRSADKSKLRCTVPPADTVTVSTRGSSPVKNTLTFADPAGTAQPVLAARFGDVSNVVPSTVTRARSTYSPFRC